VTPLVSQRHRPGQQQSKARSGHDVGKQRVGETLKPLGLPSRLRRRGAMIVPRMIMGVSCLPGSLVDLGALDQRRDFDPLQPKGAQAGEHAGSQGRREKTPEHRRPALWQGKAKA
jgi:hypothetical protein